MQALRIRELFCAGRLNQQVGRDLRSTAGIGLELENAEDVEASRARWELFGKEVVRHWTVAPQGHARKKGEKRQCYRQKTFEWLLESDNALRGITGDGWKQYVVDEQREAEEDSLSWPLGLINADNGPDGNCAMT